MKKFIVLLFSGLLLNIMLFIVSSCNDCDSGPIISRLNSISGTFKKIIGTEIQSGNEPTFIFSNYLPDSMGIRYDSLGIEIIPEMETQSTNYSPVLVNAAYACEPVTNFSMVDSIFIFSNSNYDALHPSGSNLIDIAGLRNGYSVSSYKVYEIFGGSFFLNFKSAPQTNGSHKFTVRLKLTDGRNILCVLPDVKINR